MCGAEIDFCVTTPSISKQLGTTKAQAGSAEAFEKIDREYVINAAKAAKTDDPKQRLVYLSSMSANANSRMLYTRSKGLTEQGLAALFSDCIVFRPGLLKAADRGGPPRLAETIYGKVLDVKELAKGIALAAAQGSANLAPEALATKEDPKKEGVSPYWVVGNKGCFGLSRLWK
ncbi:Protein fmp52, mitochondrial [Tulasnella sp. 408]|nr:Protein fmp52, mitochondrial [Tulasnella sp. 408]